MKSIIQNLKSQEFSRIRIGIGKPIFKEMLLGYVINKVSDKEYEDLKEGIEKGANSVSIILKNGIDNAMNIYN